MAISWAVYCGVVATLLTAAAYAWERSTRWSGRAARSGWLGALAGSVLLPWLLRLVPADGWGEAVPAALPGAVLPLDVLAVGGAREAVAGSGSALVLLAAGWVAVTAVLLAYLGWTLLSLSRARAAWQAREVDGARVWVSGDVGPAALGLRRGEIVVPAWALVLPRELRRLLLAHEREHVRAGDPRVLFAGLLCAAAMPWNPLVWFQLMRLRNAIELDCDARVLSRGADPRAYGRLLLEVGRRRSAGSLVMATMAEPRHLLEHRIRRIAAWPARRRRGRAAALATVALALCATALSARAPLGAGLPMGGPLPSAGVAADAAPAVAETVAEAQPGLGREAAPAADAAAGGHDARLRAASLPADTPRVEDGPTFTPMTVRPELRNILDVQRALARNYPPLLREAGIGGRVMVWFLIDRDGAVARTQLSRGSGYPALDTAALRVASVMQFSPAMNRDQRVPVWVEIPIAFTARGGEPTEEQARVEAARARAAETRAIVQAGAPAPEFTPMTVRPELRNGEEVRQSLVRGYPPLLRDAGIGGTALVWIYIDQAGTVQQMHLSRSSGHDSLDRAALEVAGTMKFSPARNRDEVVAVWIELPIIFQP